MSHQEHQHNMRIVNEKKTTYSARTLYTYGYFKSLATGTAILITLTKTGSAIHSVYKTNMV